MRVSIASLIMASGIAQAALAAQVGHVILVRCQDAAYGHAIAFMVSLAERMIG